MVIESHEPFTTTELTIPKGRVVRVTTRKPGHWATVMDRGLVGIFPESKLHRLYTPGSTNHDDKYLDFTDEDSRLEPITVGVTTLKRVRTINAGGNILS